MAAQPNPYGPSGIAGPALYEPPAHLELADLGPSGPAADLAVSGPCEPPDDMELQELGLPGAWPEPAAETDLLMPPADAEIVSQRRTPRLSD